MALEDPQAHWTARLRELASETRVAGAALGIWRDGEAVATSYGVLNAATGQPATPDSIFQVGSITKVWTATMIVQLVEEGRLTLDSTVADVLPGVRLGDPDASGTVTIRHLLTHSSGVDGDIFTDTGRGDDCVERYVGLLAGAARNHPVGAAYSYCNSGFSLLGRIIEVLDGRVWDASLRARLVEPLGLTHTVTLPEEAILQRAAIGHRDHPHEHEPVTTWQLPRSNGPFGLITASVADVLTFARLHLDGGVTGAGDRLLSEASVSAMQDRQRDIPSVDGRGDGIGLGWRLNRWGGRHVIGHDGGTVGQLAYLRIDVEARLAVCLLTNASVSEALYLDLFTEIFGEYVGTAPPRLPGPGAPRDESALAAHVGRYERSSWRFDVTLRDGALYGLSTMTRDAALVGDEGPQEYRLHPVDSYPNGFVTRQHDHEPWSALMFSAFPDGTPYVYTSGRATPKVS